MTRVVCVMLYGCRMCHGCLCLQIPVSDDGAGLSKSANFQTLGQAFMLLFRALTGDNVNVCGDR